MKFVELFAGIGGFRRGLEVLGHQCVGWVEIDKFARQSYMAIWPEARDEWNAGDITTVTDDAVRELSRSVGGIDILAGGFPCQAFSLAGKRRGFEDTRGTLFFEVARFASILRPKYLLLENVLGLLLNDEGRTFGTILNVLEELGYWYEWQVCNAKDFGVPQSRERVFIVGHLRGRSGRKIFPIGEPCETPGIDILGTVKARADSIGQRDAVHNVDGIVGTLTATDYKQAKLILVGMLDIKGQDAIRRVYSPTGISPTLTTMGGGNREPKILASAVIDPGRDKKTQNGRIIKEPNEPMFTPTGQDRHGVLLGKRIRRLTPRECWRLMGREDWEFDRARAVPMSDAQLYKQAGNGLVPQIVTAIAKGFEE